jgi:hypothetical protein
MPGTVYTIPPLPTWNDDLLHNRDGIWHKVYGWIINGVNYNPGQTITVNSNIDIILRGNKWNYVTFTGRFITQLESFSRGHTTLTGNFVNQGPDIGYVKCTTDFTSQKIPISVFAPDFYYCWNNPGGTAPTNTSTDIQIIDYTYDPEKLAGEVNRWIHIFRFETSTFNNGYDPVTYNAFLVGVRVANTGNRYPTSDIACGWPHKNCGCNTTVNWKWAYANEVHI